MTPRPNHSSAPHEYAPTPDPHWTPAIEAEFFTRLDTLYPFESPRPWGSGTPVPLSPVKALLLTAYAIDTLKARRLSGHYLTTLSGVMGRMARAEREQREATISQRKGAFGPRQTLRTLQAQLEAAGMLHRETRYQGHGHSGTVFVYQPNSRYVPSGDPAAELEVTYRAVEGESDYPNICGGLESEDFTH